MNLAVPQQAQPVAQSTMENVDSMYLYTWDNKSDDREEWTEIALATSTRLQDYRVSLESQSSLPIESDLPTVPDSPTAPDSPRPSTPKPKITIDWDRAARHAQINKIDRVLQGRGFRRLPVPESTTSSTFETQVSDFLTKEVEGLKGIDVKVVRILLLAGHGSRGSGGSYVPPSGDRIYPFDKLLTILHLVPTYAIAIPIVDCCYSGALNLKVSKFLTSLTTYADRHYNQAKFVVITMTQENKSGNLGCDGYYGLNACYHVITSETLEEDRWAFFEKKLSEELAKSEQVSGKKQIPMIKHRRSVPPGRVFQDLKYPNGIEEETSVPCTTQ